MFTNQKWIFALLRLINVSPIRLNLFSTWMAELYFHTIAHMSSGMVTKEPTDVSVLDVSTLAFILRAMRSQAYKNTVLPSR